jgi:hypothetical protein
MHFSPPNNQIAFIVTAFFRYEIVEFKKAEIIS